MAFAAKRDINGRVIYKPEGRVLVKEAEELLPLLAPQIAEQSVIGDYATIRQILKAQVDHRANIDRIVWTDKRGMALEVSDEALLRGVEVHGSAEIFAVVFRCDPVHDL